MLFDKKCHKIAQFVFGNGSKEPFDFKFTFFDFLESTVNEILVLSLSRCAAIPEKLQSI